MVDVITLNVDVTQWKQYEPEPQMNSSRLDRRILLKSLGAMGAAAAVSPLLSACGGGSNTGGSGVVTVRITHDETTTMVTHRVLTALAERVSERTNGDVTLEIAAQLELSGGDIATAIQQVQAGARLDAAMIATGIFSSFNGIVDVLSLPFLCRDIDDLHAMTSSDEIGGEIKKATEEVGLVTRDIWARDLRQWVNATREIRTPADMEGLTFRVPEFPLWVSAFEAVGASATPMPFGEVFTAVQTGAIDGAERPTEFLVGEGWDQVADYVTFSNYAGDALLVSFNQSFWEGLPEDIRTVLDEEIAVAGAEKLKLEKERRSEYAKTLTDSGMQLHDLTATEYETFRVAMSSVWDGAQERLPEGWIELAQGLISDVR